MNKIYQEHLKLRPFLEHFFSPEEQSRMLSFLYQDALPLSDVLNRQKFFQEVTENSDVRKCVKNIRSFYRELENGVIFYKREAEGPGYFVGAYCLLCAYVKFVENTVREVQKYKDRFHSSVLRDFCDQMEKRYSSREYAGLCVSLGKISRQLAELEHVRIQANYKDAVLCGFDFRRPKVPAVQPDLKTLLNELGVEMDFKSSATVGNKDLYYQFFLFLSRKVPELGFSLQELCKAFARHIEIATNYNIDNFRLALDFSKLYDLLKEKGVALCYPTFTTDDKIELQSIRDLSLLVQKDFLVPNDFFMGTEVAFVTGANGGGKTAFLRAIGYCAVFSRVGLFVPAERAVLPLWNQVVTVFPQEEQLGQPGRFVTEADFLEEALAHLQGDSLVLANELFSTTGEEKGIAALQALVSRLEEKGCQAVFVSHFTQGIEMFSQGGYPIYTCKIKEGQLTYEIERTLSLSSSIDILLGKYGLKKQQLKERFQVP